MQRHQGCLCLQQALCVRPVPVQHEREQVRLADARRPEQRRVRRHVEVQRQPQVLVRVFVLRLLTRLFRPRQRVRRLRKPLQRNGQAVGEPHLGLSEDLRPVLDAHPQRSGEEDGLHPCPQGGARAPQIWRGVLDLLQPVGQERLLTTEQQQPSFGTPRGHLQPRRHQRRELLGPVLAVVGHHERRLARRREVGQCRLKGLRVCDGLQKPRLRPPVRLRAADGLHREARFAEAALALDHGRRDVVVLIAERPDRRQLGLATEERDHLEPGIQQVGRLDLIRAHVPLEHQRWVRQDGPPGPMPHDGRHRLCIPLHRLCIPLHGLRQRPDLLDGQVLEPRPDLPNDGRVVAERRQEGDQERPHACSLAVAEVSQGRLRGTRKAIRPPEGEVCRARRVVAARREIVDGSQVGLVPDQRLRRLHLGLRHLHRLGQESLHPLDERLRSRLEIGVRQEQQPQRKRALRRGQRVAQRGREHGSEERFGCITESHRRAEGRGSRRYTPPLSALNPLAGLATPASRVQTGLPRCTNSLPRAGNSFPRCPKGLPRCSKRLPRSGWLDVHAGALCRGAGR